jgi:phosphoribosyl 1,2-cyclic phosphodiesterase
MRSEAATRDDRAGARVVRLLFLGTRGEIEARTVAHGRHSALLVSDGRGGVMVDCGADWLGELDRLRPEAVVLTHAHPDHAAGLRNGAPRPVHATAETWRALTRYPVDRAAVVVPGRSFDVAGISFEAFAVEHSLRAPAVGYRVGRGPAAFVYLPDVARLARPRAALAEICLYVGDGASPTRPILRGREGVLIGHASIRQQLEWCAEAGVPEAVFTHCGSQIVRGDLAAVSARVAELGRAAGVRAGLAFDGLELNIGDDGRVRTIGPRSFAHASRGSPRCESEPGAGP